MVDHRQEAITTLPTCIKLKRKERESGTSQSPRFSQMDSEMRPRLFLQKEMKQSNHFSNLESRLSLCFQPISEKALFSELIAGRYKVEI